MRGVPVIADSVKYPDIIRELIVRAARDERNFVSKAVNWALRQIGKRNATLRREAIRVAKGIRRMDSPAAKWIAADALRELGQESACVSIRRDGGVRAAARRDSARSGPRSVPRSQRHRASRA